MMTSFWFAADVLKSFGDFRECLQKGFQHCEGEHISFLTYAVCNAAVHLKKGPFFPHPSVPAYAHTKFTVSLKESEELLLYTATSSFYCVIQSLLYFFTFPWPLRNSISSAIIINHVQSQSRNTHFPQAKIFKVSGTAYYQSPDKTWQETVIRQGSFSQMCDIAAVFLVMYVKCPTASQLHTILDYSSAIWINICQLLRCPV